jgi:hypothetical protein
MPRKSHLPTADELFMYLCNGDRDEVLQRPPWACLLIFYGYPRHAA